MNISYLRPTRIVEKSENISNEEVLFTNDYEQIFLNDSSCFSCVGQGYIVLDFGKELAGGIRILSSFLEGQKSRLQIRIRFGESLSETRAEIGEKNATNDHAVRDMVVDVPDLSDFTVGDTGFRFVRIDFLTPGKVYLLKAIVASCKMRDLPYLGTFECDDPLLNKIFDTARYTVHLCCQNRIWDGIKRDRLVWIGDMQPEVLAATYIFGGQEFLEKSIAESEEHTPLPAWFGNIPTYSSWFIQIVCDYYRLVGKKEFVKARLPYINGIIKQYLDSVSNDGDIDYSKAKPEKQRGYFIDWPSSEACDLKEGDRYLLLYVLQNLQRDLNDFDYDKNGVSELIKRLQKGEKNELLREKQLLSFQVLSGGISPDDAFSSLVQNGGEGLSTYMSYFVLSAIAKKDIDKANAVLKDYYGGMLKMGATSFWEDFDLKWMEGSCRLDEYPKPGQKDIHGDHGKYCYKGYRHSLCHGWSSGPIQYIFENIVGFKTLAPGCSKVMIRPNLGNLKFIKATIPTPYGIIKINVGDGKKKIEVPAEVTLLS